MKTSRGWSASWAGPPECVCFTFSGPLTKPVHSPSRRPTKILRFQFVSHSVGHGSRGVALDSSDWTSGRLGERRRLQLGLAPKPPTQRPTETRRRRRRGSRRAEAAGSSGRARAAAQDLQALRLSVRGLLGQGEATGRDALQAAAAVPAQDRRDVQGLSPHGPGAPGHAARHRAVGTGHGGLCSGQRGN